MRGRFVGWLIVFGGLWEQSDGFRQLKNAIESRGRTDANLLHVGAFAGASQ